MFRLTFSSSSNKDVTNKVDIVLEEKSSEEDVVLDEKLSKEEDIVLEKKLSKEEDIVLEKKLNKENEIKIVIEEKKGIYKMLKFMCWCSSNKDIVEKIEDVIVEKIEDVIVEKIEEIILEESKETFDEEINQLCPPIIQNKNIY